ncbi:helix-turn-helix domain-containing protein [Rhizobium leguminosarum bv. viciae]|nr:helix-turn-helix domain-containing protein [Rhizobium leguminosarum bv. viciae]
MAINPSAGMLRAARALLGWNQRQLAAAADVSRPTINRLENRDKSDGQDKDDALLSSVEAIVRAFEAQGIEFTDASTSTGAGVRWRNPKGREGEDPTAEAVKRKL